MPKSILIVASLGFALLAGCSKPVAENPNAQLQGPSQAQMQNTYATSAKVKGGGGGMMGGNRMGTGAPYGNRMGSGAPYGGSPGAGGPPPGMMGGGTNR